MSKECMIIRDLLPLYHDDLVSDETKEFVENHLKGCEKCREELEKIKSEISISKANEEELAGLKRLKFKIAVKRMVIGVVSALTLVAALILINVGYLYFVRGFAAVSTDYEVTVEQNDDGVFTSVKIKHKDGKPIRIDTNYANNDISNKDLSKITVRETPFDLIPGESIVEIDINSESDAYFVCIIGFEDKMYLIRSTQDRKSNYILVSTTDQKYSHFVVGESKSAETILIE